MSWLIVCKREVYTQEREGVAGIGIAGGGHERQQGQQQVGARSNNLPCGNCGIACIDHVISLLIEGRELRRAIRRLETM